MKKLSLSIIAIFLFLSFSSCNPGGGSLKKSANYPESGTVHEKTVCQSATDYSYTLYLPTAFPGDKNWPVIILFDPHGSGMLPVLKYKEIAERFGYILIGSENSKNGLQPDVTNKILEALFNEVHQRYPLDTGRIYTAGFSGGARVACRAAMFRHDVRGVIGCGAGLPGGAQPPVYAFDYFGIAGTADFNLAELLQLDEAFTQMGLRHFVTTFPGPHEWPPVTVMEDGIRWHHFNAMKDGKTPKDEKEISKFRDSITARIERSRNAENFLLEADLTREAISFLEGLVPVDRYKQALMLTEGSAGYKNQIALRNRIVAQEQAEQQELLQSLFSKDLPWWKNKLSVYKQWSKKTSAPEDTLMVARLKAYLSLLCYSNATAAMKQNEHEMATRIVTIYALVDPANPEPFYLSAVLRSWADDSTACFNELNTAIAKGFSDKTRLMSQREFEAYRDSPRFFDLMQKIK